MPLDTSPGNIPLVAAAALVVALVTVPSVAQADSAKLLWEELPVQAGRCETAFNETLSEGTRCLFGNGLNLLVDESTRLAGEYGEKAFGQHFRVVGNPFVSPVPDGVRLAGDLDVVIPFAGWEPLSAEKPSGSALFLQQGVTRWWDNTGSPHNDLRHGLVYRFRLSDRPDAGILGLSMLQLHNAEQQHEVLVSGIDYTGRWGNGLLRYFSPTTGWRSNRLGQEERALAGTEFETRFDITSTFRVNATGYRWEAEDGSGHWTSGVRLGFGWRPHSWLNLVADYDRTGGGEGGMSFHAGFRMPLVRLLNPPRWDGMGVAAGSSTPTDSELWRPVEGGGQIRVATRMSVSGLVSDAEIRFLQYSVGSGDSVQLEVVLSSAAPEDIRVEVRLVPGSGNHPAVPGEDFVDQPVAMTIPGGATSGRVTIQLLRNDGQQENRSLSATVSLVS